MCVCCPNRRRFLSLTAAAPLALSACDDPPDLVSDEDAAEMGRQAWEQIRAETPISRNGDYQRLLGDVAGRLLAVAETDASGWEIEVFASPQANAFALPGGRIGVYEGMFQIAQTPDQLAAIVGHEIGHLAAEHGKERMSAQIAKNAGLRILAFALNVGGVEYGNEIAAALGLGVEVGLMLPFSRDQELEADALGLRLMDSARYDPRQSITLWERMAQANANRAPEFLATHPTPNSRIREIETILQTL